MKISLAELIAEINKLEKEMKNQFYEIPQNATSVHIREINGSEIKTSDEYDFNYNFHKYEENMEKLIAYKSLLAEMNGEPLVDGKSIHYVINTLKQNRELIKLIDACLRKKYSMQRKTDGSGPSASYYIVEKPNYDKATLEEVKEVLEMENLSLEAALQKVNLTLTVDIESLY